MLRGQEAGVELDDVHRADTELSMRPKQSDDQHENRCPTFGTVDQRRCIEEVASQGLQSPAGGESLFRQSGSRRSVASTASATNRLRRRRPTNRSNSWMSSSGITIWARAIPAPRLRTVSRR